MAQNIKIWFDPEADFLEVLFSDAPGSMRETDQDAILERVNQDGDIIGFSVLNVSQLSKEKPLSAKLVSVIPSA
ncbi:MAG: DUF2283 domain-containing protein [Synechocystis sp.]